MIYDHVSGSLSELDSMIVRAVPEGGNWRNLPEEIDSARVRQIRRSAAPGGRKPQHILWALELGSTLLHDFHVLQSPR